MDETKRAIAKIVQRQVAFSLDNLRSIGDTDVIATDVTNLTHLVTQVRVKTQSHGTRYFYVTIREQM